LPAPHACRIRAQRRHGGKAGTEEMTTMVLFWAMTVPIQSQRRLASALYESR
jgi:hypothetical protein